ncbi:UDP-3-O-(3-hydroxymyristoyl)glucosamine N-acyltransferase [Pseudovibrio exalbescens]|uniref:UDP-3-O-(3-hydroxymyristoyl)glucosamine N-acyltransferase n=1 Tax=Pseudovibrio exalbescens TaxID=197461 RepID=UPI0023669F10|nr:UDP-3-O-(3-hydroxymyristoyl)glucosamine N-acyltransferase [Pseudovibrio exalbescens]MDD7908584.1 UDP-3-O-(3-hydroxymyristoyl)glucosamine N-acyltransferase [Pseudovibrio exalbescens]
MTDPKFFSDSTPVSLKQIAEWADAELVRGDPEATVSGVAPLDEGGEGMLVFIDNPKYAPQLQDVVATACLTPKKYLDRVPEGVAALLSKDPYRSLAKVLAKMYPEAMTPLRVLGGAEIHPKAVISDSAVLEGDVVVEAGAVIGDGVHVGAGSVIGPNVVIGAQCQVGRETRICANATLQHALIGDRVILHPGVAIGQDGFGFAMGPGGHLKVPQLGRVIIQNDVEVGANTTIDRGANRDTVIGEGTKIDNQVQIGHNVNVGRHCVIVSQVGISGSATLEDYVAIGGQTGVAGHIRIGMAAQVAAVSVVNDDLPGGGRYGGTPAKPVRQWFREMAALSRLAEKDGKN